MTNQEVASICHDLVDPQFVGPIPAERKEGDETRTERNYRQDQLELIMWVFRRV